MIMMTSNNYKSTALVFAKIIQTGSGDVPNVTAPFAFELPLSNTGMSTSHVTVLSWQDTVNVVPQTDLARVHIHGEFIPYLPLHLYLTPRQGLTGRMLLSSEAPLLVCTKVNMK